MDEQQAPPPAGPPPAPPPEPPQPEVRPGNPWERRSELGPTEGFLAALKLFVVSPGEAFSQTLRKGDFGSPLLFAIIVGWIGILIGQIWETLMGASVLSMMPAEIRNYVPFVGGNVAGFLISIVFGPVYIIVGLFLWSAIIHLCLVIVGGLSRSTAGFEGSFRVVSYAMVAQLANLVPILGGFICLIWSLVLAIIGLQDLHDTSTGKAVIAVLLPVVLCCVCIGMALGLAGAGILAGLANQ